MTPERLQLEKNVLSQKLPTTPYVFKDLSTSNPYMSIAARTNRGNIYTLRIELGEFPNSVPPVYVTKMLRNRDGAEMSGASGSMHTLSSSHGCTRICHFGSNTWHPNVSLYRVYMKCRLWLEIYELHLQTGNPIDYYLKHQS